MYLWQGTRNQKGQRVFYTNEFTIFEIGKEYPQCGVDLDDDRKTSYRILEELRNNNYLCQFTDTGEIFELVNDPWK